MLVTPCCQRRVRDAASVVGVPVGVDDDVEVAAFQLRELVLHDLADRLLAGLDRGRGQRAFLPAILFHFTGVVVGPHPGPTHRLLPTAFDGGQVNIRAVSVRDIRGFPGVRDAFQVQFVAQRQGPAVTGTALKNRFAQPIVYLFPVGVDQFLRHRLAMPDHRYFVRGREVLWQIPFAESHFAGCTGRLQPVHHRFEFGTNLGVQSFVERVLADHLHVTQQLAR